MKLKLVLDFPGDFQRLWNRLVARFLGCLLFHAPNGAGKDDARNKTKMESPNGSYPLLLERRTRTLSATPCCSEPACR